MKNLQPLSGAGIGIVAYVLFSRGNPQFSLTDQAGAVQDAAGSAAQRLSDVARNA